MDARLKLKTYSHLLDLKKMPSTYELATTKLHYYLKQGFEVKTPIAAWYEKYQKGSLLQLCDENKFYDPRATTYTKYMEIQKSKEIFVAGIFASIESKSQVHHAQTEQDHSRLVPDHGPPGYERSGYDHALPVPWLHELAETLSVLRYPCHGLQMASAYVGQMAPSSRTTIAAAFQAADEMRRIQCFSYRLAQLKVRDPQAGSQGKAHWQTGRQWQPLRALIERLLVTYDWGEAFVALNLCIKPAFDGLFLVGLSRVAKQKGDYLLGEILGSLSQDAQWHRSWSQALVSALIECDGSNRNYIEDWARPWRQQIQTALGPLQNRWGIKPNET